MLFRLPSSRFFFLCAASLLAIACGSGSSSSGGSATGVDDAGGGDAPVTDGGAGADPSHPACNGAFAVSPVVQLDAAGNGGAPGLAWTGSSYGVLWNEALVAGTGSFPLYFATIGKTASKPITVTPYGSLPLLTATSAGFDAVYADESRYLASLALGPTGASGGDALQVAGSPYGVLPASAASSGTAVLAVWSEIGVIHHKVVGATLKQVESGGDAIGAPSQAVWAGDRFAFAWRGYSVGPGGVSIGEVGADGTLSNLITVWPSKEDVTNETDAHGVGAVPSLAWTGTEYRLAWAAGAQLFTAHVSRDGAIAPPTKTSFNASVLRSGAPLWDGTGYGALIASDGGLALARYTATGAPAGAPLPVSPGDRSATLIHTGREYAAAWSTPDGVGFVRIGGCP